MRLACVQAMYLDHSVSHLPGRSPDVGGESPITSRFAALVRSPEGNRDAAIIDDHSAVEQCHADLVIGDREAATGDKQPEKSGANHLAANTEQFPASCGYAAPLIRAGTL